jgi:xanthine dehydrogenase small subunit
MPGLWPHEVFFCDKLSKRRDQDISTVAAAYRLRVVDGRIEDVRVGFGGMAATPRRATQVEAALRGQPVARATFDAAAAAVAREFEPIDDWRGSASYRRAAAANLLRRLYWRIAEPDRPVEVEAL